MENLLPLPPAVRRRLMAPMTQAFGNDRFPQEQYTSPAGDPGLFGPDSVTWRVHGDASMIVGGLSALMLQALHPLAMAGVAEHSDYRQRPLQRLSRTASFVAATTFGSTEVALSVIEVVKAVHTHVRGIAPDGRPYAASDPDLLTWVHVAEVMSFVRAQRRYGVPPVPHTDVDRYFDEVAVVAELLGAVDVPRSRAEVRAYLHDTRPGLVAGHQAREALRFLMSPIGRDPLTRVVSQLLVLAAIGLLPGWAREMYGLDRMPVVESGTVRPATWAVLAALRILGGPRPWLDEARARCQAPAAGPALAA